MSITIRPAVDSDIDWILEELKSFADFYGSKLSLFGDQLYSRQFIGSLIESHVCLVAERANEGDGPGEALGFITGLVTPHTFNPNIFVLTEAFWWVKPEHRGSRAALMLLNAFTEWGKAHVDWIMFTLEDNSPVKDKTLLKRGYRFKEMNYLLETGV
jgi:hypothetical protein